MCVNRFHKIAVGQVTGLDGVEYEVMFIAAEDEEGKQAPPPLMCIPIVCLFVSGNYFITKVSYVERRVEQGSVEHDVLMLVRRHDH